MAVKDKILELMKKEIAEDPEQRGYAGKTDSEIANLLNEAYSKQVITQISMTPRISAILVGVPNTTNTTDDKEVKLAKEYIKP